MKKILIYFFVGVLLSIIYICLSISPIFINDYTEKINNKDFIVIRHRGASTLAPENTLSSVDAALKFKPARIEIDVQQTSDGIVILMHDNTLDRTTNGSGLIKEKDFLEISKLDAGSWFSESFKNEKIPTLESVLELIDGKCQLVIEIKKGSEYYPDIEKNILNIIKKKGAEKWVMIHSFDYNVLERVHNLNPKIALQKLFIGNFKFTPYVFSDKAENLNISNYPYITEYSLNYIFANRGIIEFLKSNGKKVNVWTVNDIEKANELISIGIDGIFTDNPNLLKNDKLTKHNK